MARHRWCATFVLILLTAPTLAPAQAMRRGRIVTPEGRPVAGAKVIVIERGEASEPRVRQTLTADADGRFGLGAPSGYETLLIQAPGFAWSRGVVGSEFDEKPAQTTMSLPTALRLEVVDPSGRPAAGVRVSISMIRSNAIRNFVLFLPESLKAELAQVTDAQGACVINGLPRDCVVRPDVLDDRFAKPSLDEDIVLGNKPESDVTLLRLTEGGSVSGRVVRGDTGAPVAGVRVGAQGTQHNDGGGSGVTDADGRYIIRQLSGGGYNVALDLKNELGKQFTAVAHENLIVNGGDKLEQKDFRLIPGGLIRGRALVAGSNKPVPGLHVGVYGPAHPKSGAWVQGTQTADDGSYELRVPPGSQYLYVMQEAPAGLLGPDPKDRTILVADGQVTTADFVFREDSTAGISGLVVDTDGKPVAEAIVSAEFATARPFGGGRSARTDPDGRFTLQGIPNGAIITARKGQAISVERTVVASDNRQLALTIRERAHAAIRVRVTRADGAPAAQAPVTLLQWEAVGGGGLGTERKTDADGIALFSSLNPQLRYDVSVGGSGYTRAASENVAVQPAHTSEVNLVVEIVDGSIAGVVIDPAGKAVPHLMLLVEGRQSGDRFVRTDATGRFSVPGLVPGDALTIFPQSTNGMSPPVRTTVGTQDVKVVHDPKPIPPRPEAR